MAAVAGITYQLMVDEANSGGRITGISLLIQLLTVASAWCVARAVAAPLDLPHALVLIPPVILVTAVPISIAGWGVQEGAMMAAFAYAGLSQSDGLVVSIGFGAVMFAIGILGGSGGQSVDRVRNARNQK